MLDRVSAAVEIEAPARPDKAAPTIRVGEQTILVDDCAIALARMPEARSTSSSPRRPTISGCATIPMTMAATAREYLAWLREIGLLLNRVLKDDGSFFLNIAGTNSDPWIAADAANAMRDVFRLQNSIIWVKSV